MDYDPAFFEKAGSTLDNAASSAMPTEASRESASNRLASRVSGAQRSQQQQLSQQMAGMGRSRSGEAARRQGDVRSQALGAYGAGLADINEDFWNKQQQGSQILSTIGEAQAGLGAAQNAANLGFGNLAVSEQLANIKQYEADTLAEQVAGQLDLGQQAQDLSELLGKGQLEQGGDALAITNSQNIMNNMINFLSTIGTFGGLFRQDFPGKYMDPDSTADVFSTIDDFLSGLTTQWGITDDE